MGECMGRLWRTSAREMKRPAEAGRRYPEPPWAYGQFVTFTPALPSVYVRPSGEDFAAA